VKTFPLWEGDAPGALGASPEDVPTLTVLNLQPGAKRAAVVVCPGGGYGMLAPHEAEPVAEWLESLGIAGFVHRYRLGPRYRHPVMHGDASRAIRTVRARAEEFGVDPERVGILGFSAGGHLASSVTVRNDSGDVGAADPVERQSSRPSLAILIYPVVTMGDPFTHAGSRSNLLGESPGLELIEAMSGELNVGPHTPPCFLYHGADDDAVPVENSLQFAMAMSVHRVPFELHIPECGPHGTGLGELGTPTDWRPACTQWLRGRGFV
jgi:acetyl esterase/lipase